MRPALRGFILNARTLRQVGDQVLRVFEADMDAHAGALGLPFGRGADALGVHRLNEALETALTRRYRTDRARHTASWRRVGLLMA